MSKDVRPFEEYKEMIKDMRKEEMIRGLYDLSARVIKQENIIEEVREYLDIDESIRKNCKRYDVNGIAILEILDKENKGE